MNVQVMPIRKMVVEIGYEGNHAIRLDTGTRVNYPTPAPGDINARRPYPQWGEGFGVDFSSYSHFNALEVTVRQQVTHGVSIYSTLTVEHSYGAIGYIDPLQFQLQPRHAVHRLRPSVDYSRDLRCTRHACQAVVSAANGRRLGGLGDLSVARWTAVLSEFLADHDDDINASRANLSLTNGPATLPSSQRTINQWFNAAAFTTPADYTWGNSGLDILRGPGWSELEMALQKSFAVTEGKRITFRAEATNTLNKVNLGTAVRDSGIVGLRHHSQPEWRSTTHADGVAIHLLM